METVQLCETEAVLGRNDDEELWHKKYSALKRKCDEYEEVPIPYVLCTWQRSY